jgi:hypothetical protein
VFLRRKRAWVLENSTYGIKLPCFTIFGLFLPGLAPYGWPGLRTIFSREGASGKFPSLKLAIGAGEIYWNL